MKEDNNNINKFEIESFTEEDLFDEKLSEKQMEKTKKNIFKTIKMLESLNKELNINLSLEDVLMLKKELGDESEIIEFGVRNARLLRRIVLDAIDREIKNENIEIVDELFVTSQIAIPGRVDTVALNDATYFYKIYLTKNNLIIYSLNDKYKIIKKRTLKFDKIYAIGKAPKNKGWAKGLAVFANTFDGGMSYIEPIDRTTIYLNHEYIAYEENTFRFLDKLSEVSGVKISSKDRLDKTDYIGICVYIAFILMFLYLSIKNVFF